MAVRASVAQVRQDQQQRDNLENDRGEPGSRRCTCHLESRQYDAHIRPRWQHCRGERSRPFQTYQLVAVYWIILKERFSEKGGFLADVMGLGKTVEALARFVVNRWLTVAWLDVEVS